MNQPLQWNVTSAVRNAHMVKLLKMAGLGFKKIPNERWETIFLRFHVRTWGGYL